jgi:hypothetical protein
MRVREVFPMFKGIFEDRNNLVKITRIGFQGMD